MIVSFLSTKSAASVSLPDQYVSSPSSSLMSAPDSSAHVGLFGTALVVPAACGCAAGGAGGCAGCVSPREPQADAKSRVQSKRAGFDGRVKCIRVGAC